jgi:hypothetical protein
MPSILTGLAARLVYRGLRGRQPPSRRLVILGLSLLVLICLGLLRIAMSGYVWAAMAGITAVLTLPTTIIAGLLLALKLDRRRAIISLLFIILFPVTLFVSAGIGSKYSPEALTRKSGDTIVQALEQYYVEEGIYPPTLVDLVPTYLTTIPEPRVFEGGWEGMINDEWEYQVISDTFSLRFWYLTLDDIEYCEYSSQSRQWITELRENCTFSMLE